MSAIAARAVTASVSAKQEKAVLACARWLMLHTQPCAGGQEGVVGGIGPGVLEIKCPYNRGRPEQGAPPKQPPWYYMPQVTWAGLPVKTSFLLHLPRRGHAFGELCKLCCNPR